MTELSSAVQRAFISNRFHEDVSDFKNLTLVDDGCLGSAKIFSMDPMKTHHTMKKVLLPAPFCLTVAVGPGHF